MIVPTSMDQTLHQWPSRWSLAIQTLLLTPVSWSPVNIRWIIKFMINGCPIEGSIGRSIHWTLKNLNLHVRKVFLQPAVDISSLATYTSLTPVRRSIINIRGIIKFMINDCPIKGSWKPLTYMSEGFSSNQPLTSHRWPSYTSLDTCQMKLNYCPKKRKSSMDQISHVLSEE